MPEKPKLCANCGTAKVSQGKSDNAVRARSLGLCLNCGMTGAIAKKRRKELGGKKLCAHCGTGKVSEGQSKSAVQARQLGLCVNCSMRIPGLNEKRRKLLRLKKKPTGGAAYERRAAPGEELCAHCHKRRVTRGETAELVRLRALGLCSTCGRIPGVPDARRNELALEKNRGSPTTPEAERCAHCRKAKVSQGKSQTGARARRLGLCIKCSYIPGVNADRRAALDLPSVPRPPTPGDKLCAKCRKRRVSEGRCPKSVLARELELCAMCSGIPGVNDERRKAMGIVPAPRGANAHNAGRGKTKDPFRSLDHALSDFNDEALKLEEALSTHAREAADVLERERACMVKLRAGMESTRQAASRAASLLTVGKGDVRRRTKEVESLRTATGRLKKSLPAIQEGGEEKTEPDPAPAKAEPHTPARADRHTEPSKRARGRPQRAAPPAETTYEVRETGDRNGSDEPCGFRVVRLSGSFEDRQMCPVQRFVSPTDAKGARRRAEKHARKCRKEDQG